jgi:hypothetical protein
VALTGNADVVLATTLEQAEALLRAKPLLVAIARHGIARRQWPHIARAVAFHHDSPMPVVILSASEVAREVEQRVAAALVKSRVSEAHIVQTILSLVRRHQAEA